MDIDSPKEIRKELIATGQYFFCYWYAYALKNRSSEVWRDIRYLEENDYTPKQVNYILNIAHVMGSTTKWLYKAEKMYKEYHEQWDLRIQIAEYGDVKGYHYFRPHPNNEKQKEWYQKYGRDWEYMEAVARGFVDGTYMASTQEKSLGYMITFPMFNLAYPKHFKTEAAAIKFEQGYGLDTSTGVERLPLNWRYIFSK